MHQVELEVAQIFNHDRVRRGAMYIPDHGLLAGLPRERFRVVSKARWLGQGRCFLCFSRYTFHSSSAASPGFAIPGWFKAIVAVQWALWSW